jgi:TadE-like protein
MKLRQIRDDTRGSVIVETTLTFLVFLLLMFGLLQAGLMLWTLVGLRHGVDLASRCASINDAAMNARWTTSLCFPGTQPSDVTNAMIKSYAANNSWGVNPPTSAFTVNQGVSCGTGTGNGNQVTASFTFNLMNNYIFSPTLTAQSCYPTTFEPSAPVL